MDDKDIKNSIEGIEFKKKDEILVSLLSLEGRNKEVINNDSVRNSNELSSNSKENKYVKLLKIGTGIAAGVAILFGVIFISGNKNNSQNSPAGNQTNDIETKVGDNEEYVSYENYMDVEIVACYPAETNDDVQQNSDDTIDEVATKQFDPYEVGPRGSVLVVELDDKGNRTNNMFYVSLSLIDVSYRIESLVYDAPPENWELLSEIIARRKYPVSISFNGPIFESFPAQIGAAVLTVYYDKKLLTSTAQEYGNSLGNINELEFFNDKYNTTKECNYVNGTLSEVEKCVDSENYNITLKKPNTTYYFCVSPDDFYNYDGTLVDIENSIGKEILVEYEKYDVSVSSYQEAKRMILCDTEAGLEGIPREVLLLEIEK